MQISYESYVDKILGGWIGKSIGGTLGARFEGIKAWIDLSLDEIIPEKIPPNDDLDLQVLWLKVLEEKGPAMDSDDLARAWLDGCWYPFNEYGNFRRNYRNGIKPPYTGSFNNAFYESGMGCPIRSEIWGYVFPGAPDLAARYARYDGTLDHTAESVCSELLFSAMAADAFFMSDIRRLAEKHLHYLEPGLVVTRLVHAAMQSFDEGLSLADARERLLLLGGHPEQCDAQINVPFTFLALLYGQYDLEKTVLAALQCGYDTDCTLATAGAFIGQILGAARIPQHLRSIIGDDLVMGIEYRRPEMTLSALARDTALVGLKLADALATDVRFEEAPEFTPYPEELVRPRPKIVVDYLAVPAAAPGGHVAVELTVTGARELGGDAALEIETPGDWSVVPETVRVPLIGDSDARVRADLHASEEAERWAQGHHFKARLNLDGETVSEQPFGVAGTMNWRLLGVYFDPCEPNEDGEVTREMLLEQHRRTFYPRHYYIAFRRDYIDEAAVAAHREAADPLYERASTLLGRPAFLPCRDDFIQPRELIGLRGEWVCYLDAELFSPDEREVHFNVGSNDGYRVYLNGEMIQEQDVRRWWTPMNEGIKGRLRQGWNRLLLKLFKRGDEIKFTMGIRQHYGTPEFPNKNDWVTDLCWWNPLAL